MQNVGNQNKNYKVSVVTPFHNVDLTLFEGCVASMRRQTIGFERIQWIIVLHNCQPGYLERLRAMFDGCDNVVLAELNNEMRTPSSPRNFGNAFATAPYIGYLDGDDQYLPDCLERTVSEAEATGAQVVWFRRETDASNPLLKYISSASDWDCTEERIVMDRNHWDTGKIFFGYYFYVTNCLFDRTYLVEKGISFDEQILFGEDTIFMILAFMEAQRLCFLPRFIGYTYVTNPDSLVQSPDKPADMMIRFAEGLIPIYDMLERYGIDGQQTKYFSLMIMMNLILMSNSLTAADRERIRDILAPAVESMKPLGANKFIAPIHQGSLLQIIRFVLLHPEDPRREVRRAAMDGDNEMVRITRQHAGTDFGRRYHFDALDSVRSYQEAVPVTRYEDYESLLQLQTKAGEFNILTPELMRRYLIDGEGRLMPCTDEHLARYGQTLADTLQGRINLLVARSLPVCGEPTMFGTCDTLVSAMVKEYFAKHHFAEGRLHARLTSDVQRYFRQEGRADDYADLMADALACRDLEQIVALDVEAVVSAFGALEREGAGMAERIADSVRREEVLRILAEGFNTPVAPRLWPNLRRVVAYGACASEQLQRYTGEVACNNGCCYSEATIVGRAVADNSALFESISDCNFHELLPVAEADSGGTLRPVRWSDAALEQPYYLVVSNHAGLYRYRTECIVVPRERRDRNVWFEIRG